jgi:hypothetical protein
MDRLLVAVIRVMTGLALVPATLAAVERLLVTVAARATMAAAVATTV